MSKKRNFEELTHESVVESLINLHNSGSGKILFFDKLIF
jgi:hypothetical protein